MRHLKVHITGYDQAVIGWEIPRELNGKLKNYIIEYCEVGDRNCVEQHLVAGMFIDLYWVVY